MLKKILLLSFLILGCVPNSPDLKELKDQEEVITVSKAANLKKLKDQGNIVLKKLKDQEETITALNFDFKKSVYELPKMAGRGGALAQVEADNLVLASADADFFYVDIENKSITPEYLPDIDLNIISFETSVFVNYKETPPRIHDLIFAADNFFYCAADFYDPKVDRVRFLVLKIKKGQKQWKTIYQSPFLDVHYFALGSGGKLAYDEKSQRLYFSVGDFSLDRINHLPSDIAPQNNNLPWGKINYLDLKNNSFHVYSIGHRNPQGLTILKNGQLISSEHGPYGGDEINLIEEGKNYGWPYVSYGTLYGTHEKYSRKLGKLPSNLVFNGPIYSFVPSVAPSSIYEVTNFDAEWENDLLLGSLKASSLFHLKYVDGKIIYSEPIDVKHRIRDFKIVGDSIVILTDNPYLLILKKIVNPIPVDDKNGSEG